MQNKRFEWIKGKVVLVAQRQDFCGEDCIIIEEYIDKCITFSLPIPIKLIKEVMKENEN